MTRSRYDCVDTEEIYYLKKKLAKSDLQIDDLDKLCSGEEDNYQDDDRQYRRQDSIDY